MKTFILCPLCIYPHSFPPEKLGRHLRRIHKDPEADARKKRSRGDRSDYRVTQNGPNAGRPVLCPHCGTIARKDRLKFHRCDESVCFDCGEKVRAKDWATHECLARSVRALSGGAFELGKRR